MIYSTNKTGKLKPLIVKQKDRVPQNTLLPNAFLKKNIQQYLFYFLYDCFFNFKLLSPLHEIKNIVVMLKEKKILFSSNIPNIKNSSLLEFPKISRFWKFSRLSKFRMNSHIPIFFRNGNETSTYFPLPRKINFFQNKMNFDPFR